jgi:hypothetical protein
MTILRIIRNQLWLICIYLLLSSQSEALDQLDQLLATIAPYLNDQGIDTRNSPSSSFVSETGNPQLCLLENFLPDPRIAGEDDPFSVHFNAGNSEDRAYLVAVNFPGRPQTYTARKIKEVWETASLDRRIFISFSGKDIAHATIVRRALEKLGYAVFIYKNNAKDAGAFNVAEVGAFFASAGAYYVIDSFHARGSAAVNAEALALREKHSTLRSFRVVHGDIYSKFLGEGSYSSAYGGRCCQICYTRIHCADVECDDTICKWARDLSVLPSDTPTRGVWPGLNLGGVGDPRGPADPARPDGSWLPPPLDPVPVEVPFVP